MYAELSINQGANLVSVITLSNDDSSAMNLANTTFASQIRKSYYSTNPTANINVAVFGANSNGQIRLTLSADETANIAPGRYLYDITMTANNTVTRILEGIVTVTPRVTR